MSLPEPPNSEPHKVHPSEADRIASRIAFGIGIGAVPLVGWVWMMEIAYTSFSYPDCSQTINEWMRLLEVGLLVFCVAGPLVVRRRWYAIAAIVVTVAGTAAAVFLIPKLCPTGG